MDILLKNGGSCFALDKDEVCFIHDGGAKLTIGKNEYWAIGTAFEGRQPSQWYYAGIEKVENLGYAVVLTGSVKLPQGEIFCTDSCEFQHGLLKIRRRWRYAGETVENITLSYRFRQPGGAGRVVIPGILYYGNPSGKNTPGVPYVNGTPGEKAFFEEHRMPMPFVCSENPVDFTMAAIHTLPSPVPLAAGNDIWWSCGVEYGENFTGLAGYSGFVSCNGQHGAVKTGQKVLTPLPGDGMKLVDRMVVEKSFYLQLAPAQERGSGFIPAVEAALKLHPVTALPIDAGELVRRKYRYALSREYVSGKIAGSLFNVPTNGWPGIIYGWCGRSETLGFAAPWIGEKCGDEAAWQRAEKYLDFLVTSPVDERGFCVEYCIRRAQHQEYNFVSQGQTMETFAMALQALKNAGKPVKVEYLEFLRRVCDFFHTRVMKDDWHPVSTNEAFFGAPLAMAAGLLDEKKFEQSALKIADHYIARHLTMDEPYWGGTLDASCEDKEGAVAAMTAFYAAWELSGDGKYLKAAGHATAVYLTYVQVWNIPMPPGRLADNGFSTVGWTAVSVQNMHLDVYGVWVAPLLWKIGRALKRTQWQDLAWPTFVNCGEMTDIYGSQGEQFEQTNFCQQPFRIAGAPLRGGYSENWVVFWITAAFLNSAAQFELLGIPVFDREV